MAGISRPADVPALCGNAAKAKTELGWQPTTALEQLIAMMTEARPQARQGRALIFSMRSLHFGGTIQPGGTQRARCSSSMTRSWSMAPHGPMNFETSTMRSPSLLTRPVNGIGVKAVTSHAMRLCQSQYSDVPVKHK
jgi:hypothetical protein